MSEALISTSIMPMFCDCSFHGNSMNNILSCCGLVDARISASEKDLPVNMEFSVNMESIHEI